jgi:uncharacterized SAM-binding protein YcdF (DUF218 family)
MTFTLSKIVGTLLLPTSVICIAIAVGLAMAARRRASCVGLRVAATGFLALIACGTLPVGTLLLVPLEQRFPRAQIEPGDRTFAGIIVLGGAEDGRLSRFHDQLHLTEAAERITEAARLAHRLPALRLAFTGGVAFPGRGNVSGAERIADWWRGVGIASERIVIEGVSRNTHENALMLRAVLEPKAGDRWLLVTSAAHMPRAVGVFREAGFDVTAYPVDYRTEGWSDATQVSTDIASGLKRADEAVREWIGIFAYRLLGRTSALFPSP